MSRARAVVGRSATRLLSRAVRTPRAAHHAVVDLLEDRRLFAVFLDAPIADISVRPGTPGVTIPLASRLRTTNLDGITGTVVRMPVQYGSGSTRVDSSINFLLFDQATPLTVQNFINYVTSDRYDNSIIHASFIARADGSTTSLIQGGGFKFSNGVFDVVATNAPITNEFSSSPKDSLGRVNTRGTIAMARASDTNITTSQWFINTTDNSAALDNAPSGGYAVFGRVLGGLPIIDQINALPVYNASQITQAFNHIPLAEYGNGNAIKAANVVTFSDAAVVAQPKTYFDYKIASSDPKVATVTVDSGGNLTVAYPAKSKMGTTTITLTATDLTGATVTDTFSVTVAAPALAVTYGTAKITSGQASPIDLGTAFTGQSATRTFTFKNSGKGLLTFGDVSVPAGFTVSQALPGTLAPGASANLILAVDTAAPASRTGTISVVTDASDQPFSIPVTLEVGSGVTLGGAVKSIVYANASSGKTAFSLKGAGTARLEFTGAGLSASIAKGVVTVTGSDVHLTTLTLANTNGTTALSSTAKGGVAIDTLSSATPLKQVALKGITITSALSLAAGVNDLAVAGLDSALADVGSQVPSAPAKAIVLGTVTESNVTIAGAVKALTFSSLSGGTVTLSGGSVGTLTMASATNTLVDSKVPIGSVKILGALTSTTFQSTSPITKFEAGSMSFSKLHIGLAPGVDLPTGGASFTGNSTLGSMTLKSKSPDAFASSEIFAFNLGKLALGTLTESGGKSTLLGVNVTSVAGKNAAGKSFNIRGGDVPAALIAAGIPAERLAVTLF